MRGGLLRPGSALMLGLAALVFPFAASASGVSALVGGTLHGISTMPELSTQSAEASRGFGFVGGVLADFDLTGPLGIQLGAMVATPKYSVSSTVNTNEFSITGTQVQFPVQARLSLPGLPVFGAGLYFAEAVGDLTCSGSCAATESTYAQNGYKTSDFGMVLSAGTSFGIGLISVVLEGRYLQGFSNQVQDPSLAFVAEQKQSDFQLLTGVRLAL